ncbi:hypothetical protein NQ166_14130 [Microbacterium sp. zg.Y1090]|uniref:hypothetical protein n=1 Tax=Microbacterium TaxID=33882 RepID=UPI00214AA5CE|nr:MULTISPECIES: hypothetical protein [unclassified Microbacterium]MCR2812285.1 hypothetical protein [Microbacterium sp. zg.Y1084]MCR2819969.1 hypothetical protein [Microbacterium sp. zg.Y1090]MDL5488201.1 hypothetical protein [Microbacterium sp. zg-Y1211]WIM29301.1 hypothetical protein QNO26_05240 [Microbacterium sp. zg-Y1090]
MTQDKARTFVFWVFSVIAVMFIVAGGWALFAGRDSWFLTFVSGPVLIAIGVATLVVFLRYRAGQK